MAWELNMGQNITIAFQAAYNDIWSINMIDGLIEHDVTYII